MAAILRDGTETLKSDLEMVSCILMWRINDEKLKRESIVGVFSKMVLSYKDEMEKALTLLESGQPEHATTVLRDAVEGKHFKNIILD